MVTTVPSLNLRFSVIVLVCYSEAVYVVCAGANELISFLTLKNWIFILFEM